MEKSGNIIVERIRPFSNYILVAIIVVLLVLWLSKSDNVVVQPPHVIDVDSILETSQNKIDSLTIRLDESQIKYDSIQRLIRMLNESYANQIKYLDSTSVDDDVEFLRAKLPKSEYNK